MSLLDIAQDITVFTPDVHSEASSPWVQTAQYVKEQKHGGNIRITIEAGQLSNHLLHDLIDHAQDRGGDLRMVQEAQDLAGVVFPDIGLFVERVEE